MEFQIPNAPAVGLTQQMGEGYAQVLDTSTFDPITFLTNYNKNREDAIKEQAKQDMQRKAKWKAYQIPVPTDIFESNNAEIESAIDEWGVVMQDAMASGVDPDSPEFYKEFAKYKAKVNEAAAEGKALETMVKGYYDKVKQNPEKYDPEKFQEWVNGLKEQPNLKARKEYVATTNPLAEKFKFENLVPDLIPPTDMYENASGVTVSKTSRKRLRNNIENKLALAKLDPQKAEYIQQGFEKGVEDGLWKDVDGMVDWYTDYGMNLGGESKVTRESGGGGMSISFNPNGANYGDIVVTDIYEKTDTNLAEGLNGVAVSKDGKDAPPVTLQFDDGTMEAFVPIRFYKTKEGFWRVEGKRGRSGSIYKTFDEANNNKGAGGKIQKTADGQYEVVTISSETISIPYSETNKKILKGHLNGFDVVEYEAKKGGGKATSAAPIKLSKGSLNDITANSATSDSSPKNDLEYQKFKKTLPDNLKNTDESHYDMYYYWKNSGKPKNFDAAKKEQMFSMEDDGYYHAPSVEPNTLRFLKPKDHPTVQMELDWYNSNNPEAIEFRSKYDLDKSGRYYRYVPKVK